MTIAQCLAIVISLQDNYNAISDLRLADDIVAEVDTCVMKMIIFMFTQFQRADVYAAVNEYDLTHEFDSTNSEFNYSYADLFRSYEPS